MVCTQSNDLKMLNAKVTTGEQWKQWKILTLSLCDWKKQTPSLPRKISKYTEDLNNTINITYLTEPQTPQMESFSLSAHKSFTKTDPKLVLKTSLSRLQGLKSADSSPRGVKLGAVITKKLKSPRGSEMKQSLLNNPGSKKKLQ